MPDDVTPVESSATTETPAADTAPVSSSPRADDSQPVTTDRPVENAVHEFQRKFTRLERQMEAMTQYLAQSAQARPTPAASGGEVTDDDLWRLAQQGDRSAFDLYMQRTASRVVTPALQGDRQARLVEAQLAQLGQMYPVLNDPGHALTQTVQQAYHLLVGQGYPASRSTLLDAAKTAIADRPDLVVELRGQAQVTRDAGRRSATQVAQAGQMGASSRATPAPAPAAKKPLSEDEKALAKRMGLDPKRAQEAKERFLKRQAAGQSHLGAVGMHVREEEL